MNVIISNKYKQDLEGLEIDISKKLEGEYDVEELIDTFSNYFFNKMLIDITAIKNYESFNTLQKLSTGLNVEKIIFLLDRDNVNPSFLSQLVSIGIYNFTTTKDGIMYLYNNPNSYKDVAQYQDSKFVPSNKESKVLEEKNEQKEQKYENVNTIDTKEDYRNTIMKSRVSGSNQHIVGVKNLTSHAGATSLIYMLKKELSNYKDVIGIEISKRDFMFLRDSDLISVEPKDLYNELSKQNNRDVIFIDLNNYGDTTICTDILYLIEPSTIKLNKMIMLDRKIFEKMSGKKIVLNKSLLDKKDISSFELESSSSIYYNIPPLDEKVSNADHLLPFLEKLGLLDSYTANNDSNSDKFLGLFNI